MNIKYFLAMLLVSAIIAFAISYFRSLDFLPMFTIVVLAILINGLFATWEDNQTGGFNNS